MRRLAHIFRRQCADLHGEDPGGGVYVRRGVPYGSSRLDGTMDIHAPTMSSRVPTIVLAHSVNGAKEDLTQFAFALASAGARVCNVDWRGQGIGEWYPSGYRNLAGALKYARQHFDEAADGVTLAAWSDASIVGAVVALDPQLRSIGGADAFIGLGGYYGWPESEPPLNVISDTTVAFFGVHPDVDQAPWRAGNPHGHLRDSPRVSFTLIVGARDQLLQDAEAFAEALSVNDHRVSIVVVPNCGHTDLVIPRLPSGRFAIRSVMAVIRGKGGAEDP